MYLYIKNAYLFQPNKKAKIIDIDLKTSDAIIHQKEGENQGDNGKNVRWFIFPTTILLWLLVDCSATEQIFKGMFAEQKVKKSSADEVTLFCR